MSTITVPKKLLQGDDVVLVPRKEYEKLFSFWTNAERLTRRDKNAIGQGLREIKDGKFFTSKQVREILGI